jgi:sugar transferase (PEP-CTERM/EpsH1 system associated)
MNILFIVPYVPSKIRSRSYNLIRFLVGRGNRVTLVTLWTDELEKQELRDIQQVCQETYALPMPAWRSLLNCIAALPTSKPLQTAYSWNPELAEQACQLAVGGNGRGKFDVIHVEHLRGVQYGLYLKSQLADRSRLPIIWDSVDAISLLFRQAMVESKSLSSRTLTRFELGRTERYEGWLLNQFDQVLVTSPCDQKALIDLVPAGEPSPHVNVLRNGVDFGYFQPNNAVPREPASVVISGKMSYHANVTMTMNFIHQIMPLVWQARPEVKVYVVGKDPAPQVQALGSEPRVEVTGTVSDIRPYLWKASLSAAPIAYGAGIQNKVLEAMACGTSVVASSQAVSALTVIPGQDALVADNPTDFAAAILALLKDVPLRNNLGRAGRAYVEQNHNWDSKAAQLETIYERAIQTRQGVEVNI